MKQKSEKRVTPTGTDKTVTEIQRVGVSLNKRGRKNLKICMGHCQNSVECLTEELCKKIKTLSRFVEHNGNNNKL